MQEKPADAHPLSDLAYDWITLIQNKAQALMAYDQYIKDAEQAGSPECAAFFRKVHDSDKAQLAEAKGHLVAAGQDGPRLSVRAFPPASRLHYRIDCDPRRHTRFALIEARRTVVQFMKPALRLQGFMMHLSARISSRRWRPVPRSA